MKLDIKIGGKTKTFFQNEINFKTMRLALEWQERLDKQVAATMAMIQDNIEDETLSEEERAELFKPQEDLELSAQLIVSFFNDQFTYDEFIQGAFFPSAAGLYQMARDIFELAFNQKEVAEKKSKKVSATGRK